MWVIYEIGLFCFISGDILKSLHDPWKDCKDLFLDFQEIQVTVSEDFKDLVH